MVNPHRGEIAAVIDGREQGVLAESVEHRLTRPAALRHLDHGRTRSNTRPRNQKFSTPAHNA